jgi:hypothetical protein
VTNKKPKYDPAVVWRSVDIARMANMLEYKTSDEVILFGYDAPFCNLVSTTIAVRFVTVETEISAAWKWFKIHSLVRNLC